MLWYKAWLETRWRFVIGLVLLTCAAVAYVMWYPRLAEQLSAAEPSELGDGFVAGQIRQAIEMARDYRGYIWSQWIRQSLRETWTLFAVLLGTGGLLAQTSSGAALFTLSMPVSRRRLLGTRAAIGLAELLVLAIVPALVVPLLSPAIGYSYSAVDALVHAFCLFVAGILFFSLAFLLSTVFSDIWRPPLITLGIAYALVFAEQLSREAGRFGILRVMSAQTYYRSGEIPWVELLLGGAVSAALLYGAVINIERRDF